MKLRKVRSSSKNDQAYIEAWVSDRWVPVSQAEDLGGIAKQFHVDGDLATDMLAVLQLGQQGWGRLDAALQPKATGAQDTDPHLEVVQPFQPASFREFSLFDEHLANVSRQHVKRYMPSLYPVVHWYETLLKKTFPLFKPNKLWHEQPIYYYGSHLNFYSDNQTVTWPDYVDDLDYELEFAAVISRQVCDVGVQEASEAIGGFVIVNDFSSRGQAQKREMESGCGPQKSKHFANSMSNVVVTADEILGQEHMLSGRVRINGTTVCSCHSNNIRFSFPEIVSFLSQGQTLFPGELLASGALPGSSGLENGCFLKPGDRLELQIDGLGSLENTIDGNGLSRTR